MNGTPDEIRRVRLTATRAVLRYAPGLLEDARILADEVERQDREVERLRAALEAVLRSGYHGAYCSVTPCTCGHGPSEDVARAALKGGDDGQA